MALTRIRASDEESDIDIYVVVPDSVSDVSELYGDIQMSLWKKKTVPLDLLIGKSSIFNKRKVGPTLERVIAEKGTIILDCIVKDGF